MAKQILAWSDAAGQFYREIGKRQNGKAPRFYLGSDERQATANVARLEGLWTGIETRWQDLHDEELTEDPVACWDDETLLLGRAISKGEWRITLEPPDDGSQEIAIWLAHFIPTFR